MSKKNRKNKKYQGPKLLKRPENFHSFSECVKWLKKSVYIVVRGKKVKVDGLSEIPRSENKRGFLIDDAVSGGSILKESVEILRSHQLRVDDVYVLFSRKEDGAIQDYKQASISLHSIFDLNDEGIKRIINTEEGTLDTIIDEL